MEYPISLYYDTEVSDVKTLDLCRGDDDYRKVHIVDDGHRKLVIKYLSNTFSDRRRIEGWFALMNEYRKIGLFLSLGSTMCYLFFSFWHKKSTELFFLCAVCFGRFSFSREFKSIQYRKISLFHLRNRT